MKTLKLNKQFSLKKEKIATLNKQQLNSIHGGGTLTWINCPVYPTKIGEATNACWGFV